MQFDFRLERAEDQTPSPDTLHIKAGKSRGSVSGYINIFRFQDKDTNQWVLFVPSLELSGYGENPEKAHSMLKEALDDLFRQLITMSPSELRSELSKLGWKKNFFRNKDFSRAYVTEDGELKNFNTEKVEHLALVA